MCPMPSRPCLTCGALVTTGSYCPRHEPKRENRQTAGRGGGSAARTFRSAVLAKAGGQCEWISVGDVRCTATIALEAHHLVPLTNGGTNDPANGRALCRRHHRLAERLDPGD